MPNLAKSQTEWTNLFREFAQYLRLWRTARALAGRFQKGRIRVFEINDTTDKLSLWTLAGAKRGINISEDGRLWITVLDETPGAGQARVQLFMDSAKTQEVARGDAADGATVTLAAQNNSGLTGTVKIGTITTGLTAPILIIDIDESLKNQRAFDLSTPGGVAANNRITSRVNSLGTQFSSLLATIKDDIERGFIGTKLREFLKSTETQVINVTEAPDSNGDIQVTYGGVLGDLIDAMADNTVVQTILQNTVAATPITYDGDNVGLGVLSVLASRQNLEPGELTLLCTAGKDDTLEEKFAASLISSIDGAIVRGRLELTIKKQWESRDIGLRLQLDRTISDSNDGGNQVGTYVISGETLSNTDSGVLYLTLEAGAFSGGTNRRVRLYSDAAKANLVAEGLRTGDGTVTLSPMNNSGLSGSCVIAYASDDFDIQVNLNPFKKGDIIRVTCSNDKAGMFNALFMDIWDVPLGSGGVPTIDDAILKEALDHLAAGALPLP